MRLLLVWWWWGRYIWLFSYRWCNGLDCSGWHFGNFLNFLARSYDSSLRFLSLDYWISLKLCRALDLSNPRQCLLWLLVFHLLRNLLVEFDDWAQLRKFLVECLGSELLFDYRSLFGLFVWIRLPRNRWIFLSLLNFIFFLDLTELRFFNRLWHLPFQVIAVLLQDIDQLALQFRSLLHFSQLRL